jgi:hypothetical protein
MGVFFDQNPHKITAGTISTLRKLPLSDGAVNRIIKKPKSFEYARIPCKASFRKMYKSGRILMCYNIDMLMDGLHEAISIGDENVRVRHFFTVVNGQVESALDDVENYNEEEITE